MAKKEKTQDVVEEIKDTTKNEPKGKETKGDVTKVKAKMKQKPQVVEETITKVDLNKPLKKEETNYMLKSVKVTNNLTAMIEGKGNPTLLKSFR